MKTNLRQTMQSEFGDYTIIRSEQGFRVVHTAKGAAMTTEPTHADATKYARQLMEQQTLVNVLGIDGAIEHMRSN